MLGRSLFFAKVVSRFGESSRFSIWRIDRKFANGRCEFWHQNFSGDGWRSSLEKNQEMRFITNTGAAACSNTQLALGG